MFGLLGLGAYAFLGSILVAFVRALVFIWLLGIVTHSHMRKPRSRSDTQATAVFGKESPARNCLAGLLRNY